MHLTLFEQQNEMGISTVHSACSEHWIPFAIDKVPQTLSLCVMVTPVGMGPT